MVRLRILGGLRQIGGNKILLEQEGQGLLLDFGLDLFRFRLFFEEFLRPRTARGLTDFFKLGFLPPFDWYRLDLCPPDLELTLSPCELKGVILTHAHLDHYGLVGLLREDFPLIATPETAALLKALQVSGMTEFWREWVAIRPRESRSQAGHHVLQALRQSRRWRIFRLPQVPSSLRDFWLMGEGEGVSLPDPTRVLREGFPEGISLLPVYHSVPGSAMVRIDTPEGPVIYTGDLRFGLGEDSLEAFLRRLEGLRPRVLIIEGTNVGEERALLTNEGEVLAAFFQALSSARGRLVVTDFPSLHLERLRNLLLAASEAGRRVLLLPRDFWLVLAVEAAGSPLFAHLREAPLGLYPEPKASLSQPEKLILERYASFLVTSREVASDPGAFVLALGLWNISHLLDLAPEALKGGLYLHAQGEPFTEEQLFDQRRLLNWLNYLKLTPFGWEERSFSLHASSHATEEEIFALIEALSPEIVIPIHTRHPEIFRRRLGGKVPENLEEVIL